MNTSDSSTIPPDLPQVTLYCDGAAIPNPGNTGVGVVLLFGDHRKEISRTIGQGSNNSSEIMACVVGLNALKVPCAVTLVSDSQYVVRTMTGEYSHKTNLALWALLDAAAARHVVEWQWTRGHVGQPENERANALAEQAARRRDAPLFEGVEP
ncbi:MAG: hypothetical protein M0Z43_13550 [Acidithiobacillus sp.]|nr:hypothetical protein [Acidithiobacillus sp.]